MNLKNTKIVVTGGSRGLGLGLVEALVEQGAHVTVVARDRTARATLASRLEVDTISADVTVQDVALRVLGEVRPQVLILNAGATPQMGRIDELSWSQFTSTWETDVKAGLYWMQAALNLPLAPGARVLVTSSGAALDGSPLSGGYAGAKRMLWLMAKYANKIADKKKIDVQFQAIVPRQMVGGTGIGDEASAAYSQFLGVDRGAYLSRFGAPLPPRLFGDHVVSVLVDPQYSRSTALNVKGDTGVTILEGAAD